MKYPFLYTTAVLRKAAGDAGYYDMGMSSPLKGEWVFASR